METEELGEIGNTENEKIREKNSKTSRVNLTSRGYLVDPKEVLKEVFDKGNMKSSIFGRFENRRKIEKREVKSARILRSRGRRVRKVGKPKTPFEKVTQKYGHLPIFGKKSKSGRKSYKRRSTKKLESVKLTKRLDELRGSLKNVFEPDLSDKENIENIRENLLREKSEENLKGKNLLRTYESPVFYISHKKENKQNSRSRPSLRSSSMRNKARTDRPKITKNENLTIRENQGNLTDVRDGRSAYNRVLDKRAKRRSSNKTKKRGPFKSVYGDVEFRRRKARQQSLNYKKKKRRKVTKLDKKQQKLTEKIYKGKNGFEEKLKKLNKKVERMSQKNRAILNDYNWERQLELKLAHDLIQKNPNNLKSTSEKDSFSNNQILNTYLTKSAKSKIESSTLTPRNPTSHLLTITPTSKNPKKHHFFSSKKYSNLLALKPYGNTPATPRSPPAHECVFKIPDTQTKIENYPEFKFLIKKISPLSSEKNGVLEKKELDRMDMKLMKILPNYEKPDGYDREEKLRYQNFVIRELKGVLAREQNMRLEKERQMLMMLVEDQRNVEFLENRLEEVFPKTGRSASRKKSRGGSAKIGEIGLSLKNSRKSKNSRNSKFSRSSQRKKEKLRSDREVRSGGGRRTGKKSSSRKKFSKGKFLREKNVKGKISKALNFDLEVEKENMNMGDGQFRERDRKREMDRIRALEDYNFLYEDEDAYSIESSVEREATLRRIKDKYKKMIEREQDGC
jgi:hypothetical protein